MKIDANSDGIVDWNEFSTYMMMGSLEMTDKVINWDSNCATKIQLTTSPSCLQKVVFNERDKKSYEGRGRDMIKKIDYIPKERKYITVSRDGYALLWNTDFLIQKSIQTRELTSSDAWITDAIFMHEYNKLVTINDDRQLCIFDVLSIKARCLLIVGCLEHNPTSICFARKYDY